LSSITTGRLTLLFITLFFLTRTNAQICTGSLGDPVVNITFGSGSNPGNPLAASLPNLTYTSELCPNDGYYTIVNSTGGCFGNTWHSVPADHTPNDVNGYMMLINASFNSGDFYVNSVTGLCGGTTYEFAAWVTNVLQPFACGGNGISPNLIFNIESENGTVLGTYSTGSIPHSGSSNWQQYGLFFTTPATASTVILRITNTAPGGCGNDLFLDDITFRPCGPTVQSSIVGTAATAVDRCVTDLAPIAIQATVSLGYNKPVLQWQKSKDGQNWTDIAGANKLLIVHNPSGAGVFKYRLGVSETGNVNSPSCRIFSNEITITVHELPGKGMTSNSPVCTNNNILLHAGSGSIFSWKGPSNFSDTSANPIIPATLAAAGKYYLDAADSFGCKNKDSLTVVVNVSPVASAPYSLNLCEDDSAIISASGGTTYLWSPATNLSAPNVSSPTAVAKDSITYTVSVGNSIGCADTSSVSINVIRKPVANAGPDKFIFEGQSIMLNGTIGGSNVTYFWTPPEFMANSNTLSPIVNPVDNISYYLHAESNSGCVSAIDEVFVRVFKKITVPNAFSPNGDGINDVWHIKSLITYPEAKLSVFNRYGQLVFTSTGYEHPWDGTRNGKPVAVDTYYYIIDLKNNIPKMQGSVFIIR
jgi:gliding motility-associated-like protein